jgi:hypothetical protein
MNELLWTTVLELGLSEPAFRNISVDRNTVIPDSIGQCQRHVFAIQTLGWSAHKAV